MNVQSFIGLFETRLENAERRVRAAHRGSDAQLRIKLENARYWLWADMMCNGQTAEVVMRERDEAQAKASKYEKENRILRAELENHDREILRRNAQQPRK